MNFSSPSFNRHLVISASSIFVIAACWILFYIGDVPRTYSLSETEGANLMQARLINAGHGLYTTIPSNTPPLLPELLAASFRIFGDHVQTARWLMAFHSFLLLLLTGRAAWILFGGTAGILATVFTGGSMVFAYSVCDIQGALVSMTWGMAGFVLIISPGSLSIPLRVGISGIMCGLTFLADSASGAILLLHMLAIAHTQAATIQAPGNEGLLRFGRTVSFFLLCGVAAYGIAFILYPPLVYHDHVLTDQAAALTGRRIGLASLLTVLKTFGYEHFGLVLLMLTGACYLFARQWRHGLILVAWLAAALFSLVWSGFASRPELIALLIPVTLLASANSLWIEKLVRRSTLGLYSLCLLPVALFAIQPNGYVWFVPQKLMDVRLRGRSNAEVRAAITFIKENSAKDQFVLSDQSMLVFWSDRLMPPAFASISTGSLMVRADLFSHLEDAPEDVRMLVISKKNNDAWLKVSKHFDHGFTRKEITGYTVWLKQGPHDARSSAIPMQ